MRHGDYDAVIIGGGPGGSTVATRLARDGKRVLVLEKELFPRFHIGESLLPYNRRIFEDLGVLGKLEAAGFTIKTGAQFHAANASTALKLVFKNGCFTRETQAFQVERSVFDDLLLRHARTSGAEVLHGWRVTAVAAERDAVAVEASNGDEIAVFRGRFLVDASGRSNVTGNQERLRVVHASPRNVALFGHFDGVQLDEGAAAGDTVIVRSNDRWFWLIPLGRKVSVGCVLDQRLLDRDREGPAELFLRSCESSNAMRSRMRNARLIGAIQVTNDFSYYNRRLVGRRLLRVGDAAGFMDPIFSAGVYLAMHSGQLAADAVLQSLKAGNDGRAQLAAYEKRIFRGMRYYWEMVQKFYTAGFMDLFMQPKPRFNLPDAIVAILAGELEGGWKLELRRRMFFTLLRLQQVFPVVPRLSLDEPVVSGASARETSPVPAAPGLPTTPSPGS